MVLSFSVASATIINVPVDFSTIQMAIDSSSNGDTVLVADGIYTGEGNRDITFNGKSIVVRSENGPDSTVILGPPDTLQIGARGFVFNSGETADSKLIGFTVSDFRQRFLDCDMHGGGILINNSSPIIDSCKILRCGKWNGSSGGGGGIYCSFSSTIISNSEISSNFDCDYGGGIYIKNSTITLNNCIIADNLLGGACGCLGGQQWGFGIYSTNSTINIYNCIIVGNEHLNIYTEWDKGGGICIEGGLANIINSQINANFSYNSAGCHINSANVLIEACEIKNNSSGHPGGGLTCEGSSQLTIINSTIAGNSGYIHGGGLNLKGGTVSMQSCTITKNRVQRYNDEVYGGGISIRDANVQIDSCIIAFNTVLDEGQGGGIWTNTQFGITCSDVYGNIAYIDSNYSGIADQTGINGNISLNPLFCNINNEDYSLDSLSPCLPGHILNSCSTLIGALGVGCGLTTIPTLSEWGMLIMGLLLLAVGTAAVVRRREKAFIKA
jgi:hypothetical protein